MRRTRRKKNKGKTKRKRGGVLSAKELAAKEALIASIKSEQAELIASENRLRLTLGLSPLGPTESHIYPPSEVRIPRRRNRIELIIEQLRNKYTPETLGRVKVLLGYMKMDVHDTDEQILGIIEGIYPFELGQDIEPLDEDRSCILSQKRIDTSKTVHLWINTHGLETEDLLSTFKLKSGSSLPSCSAVGQKVGFTSRLHTNISVNLDRLKELKRIYGHGPLQHQMQAAEEVFIPHYSSIPWEMNKISKQ